MDTIILNTLDQKTIALNEAMNKALITDFSKIQPPKGVVTNPIDNKESILFEGSINAITGQGGSRKTTFITSLVSNLSKTDTQIIWIDTEQSTHEMKYIESKITKQGGNLNNIKFYSFLKIENEIDYLELFKHIIKDSDNRLKLIVLDNVTDFDDNCIMEASAAVRLTRTLSKISKARNLAILAVIHQNEGEKADQKARGQIGSEFIRKSSTVINVSRNKDVFNESKVVFSKARNFVGHEFSFEVDQNNVPMYDTNNYNIPEKLVKETNKEVKTLNLFKIK